MNTARHEGRPLRRRKASLGLIVVYGSACSFAVADGSGPPPPPESPHILYRVSERSPTSSLVTLIPQQLRGATDFGETDAVRLYIGCTGTFRSGSPTDPYNNLALIILAARDSVSPVLQENRQLLLDIDGEMIGSRPSPDPRLYSFGPSGLGYTETVIVPIDLELLTRLTEAKTVRGRVGHWLTFEIPPAVLSRLNDLRTALPSDFPTGRQLRTPIVMRHIAS